MDDLISAFSEVIRAVKRWRPDFVIGDAVSFYWAKDHDLNAYLIESSMETIVDAFERAMLVLNNLNRHLSNEKRLSAVLDCTKEGAILVDRQGNIEEVNQQGCTTTPDPMWPSTAPPFPARFWKANCSAMPPGPSRRRCVQAKQAF